MRLDYFSYLFRVYSEAETGLLMFDLLKNSRWSMCSKSVNYKMLK